LDIESLRLALAQASLTGLIVGFATAYPVNVWMVSKNLKHGLMHVELPSASVTEPGVQAKPAPAGAAAPGHGPHQLGGR